MFGINLFLNVLWSFLFFGLKNPVLAFFELIFLWISIWAIMFFSCRINNKKDRVSLILFITFLLQECVFNNLIRGRASILFWLLVITILSGSNLYNHKNNSYSL